MISRTSVLAALLVISGLCQAQITFDPKQVYTAALKCDLQPLKAVESACKEETARGREHKPGCEVVKQVKVWDIEAQVGFVSYKHLPKCEGIK